MDMHPYRRIPAWLFWPLAILVILAWLFLMAWLVLKFFGGVDVGMNPLEAIPRLLQATNGEF